MVTLREQFMNGGGCRVIDSHGHLGPFNGIYMPEASLENMIKGMDRRGIESIILSPHSALSGDTREGNREMLEAVEQYPGRVYGYCTVNPNFPADIEGEMDVCLAHPGVVGIKLHPVMHNYPVGGTRYAPVWERAQHDRLMLLSHTWGKSGGCGADDLRAIAERYPDVRLILGHSCYGAWEEAIALARDFPNVYLELTAAYHVYGLLEWMCRDAGSEKVLFGTDYPWFDPFAAIGCVVFAHITEDGMRNILWANARRLLDEQLDKR
jgi:hypothetical protein